MGETITEVIIKLVDSGFFDKARAFKEIRNNVEWEVGFIQYSTLYPVVLHVCTLGLISRRKGKNYYEFIKTEVQS